MVFQKGHKINFFSLQKNISKKGAGTAAILEGVAISTLLMGRYLGWACGY